MKAIKFSEYIIINKPSATVFDFTQDYSNRLQWDTFLKKAHLLNGATTAGKGIKTYCVAKNGIGIETEYVTFKRPKVTAVKMTNSSFIFKTFSGSWTFGEVHATQTRVSFLYLFTLKFPFNLFSYFIKQHLQRNVQQRLTDLKTCLEK